jgi:hypothetical protein
LAASAVPGYHRGMRRAQLGVVIAAALAVATGRAHGQAEVWDGAGRGYIHVPGLAAGGGGLPSRVIFVNDCKPNGCPIVPGNFRLADDSRQNISSIVRPVSTSDPYATRRLAPYTGTAAAWQATIDCVRAAYAPFDVTVVTTEPPPSTSYFEVMAAGLPADIGFPSSVVGVASFACGVIPNAISFAFLNRNPGNVLDACWTVAQQAAHSVGLAHEVLPGDVMSASFSPPEKTFRNQLACIGATGCCEPSQECACGVTDQNSFAALVGLFGPAGPTPPALTLHRPAANAVVAPGFAVEVAIADANGIDHAELRIDDVAVQTVRDGGPTWSFQAPAALAPGPHTVAIHAVDRLGTSATLATEVTVAPGCDDHADCAEPRPRPGVRRWSLPGRPRRPRRPGRAVRHAGRLRSRALRRGRRRAPVRRGLSGRRVRRGRGLRDRQRRRRGVLAERGRRLRLRHGRRRADRADRDRPRAGRASRPSPTVSGVPWATLAPSGAHPRAAAPPGLR